MIEQYAHSIAVFLMNNPHWGGFITFTVAFLESLAIIGTIVPGSITMTAIGMLIGSSVLPFSMTLLWATTGAFAGDLIGYGLGSYYNERLRNMWPFKKHPQWLEAGESFFHKHSGKSILIGRFIGPLRSIIPLIAGLLHMPLLRFCLAAIPAAFLWAVAYMLPGILLGTLSLQLPRSVATKFILYLLLAIVLLSLFAWLLNIFSNKIRKISKRWLKKRWQQLNSKPQYASFTRLLATNNPQRDYQQLGWLILAALAFITFFALALNVFFHSELTDLNQPLFEFLRSIRTSKIDSVIIGITLLGDARLISLTTLLLLAWLLSYQKKRAAMHWLLACVIGLVVPNVVKVLFYFPRPTGLLHVSSASSFPSGHVFISVMFYGFFALFLASHIKQRYKRYPCYFAGMIIILMAFSRLYLGAHWLTDVLASISLATAFLSLVILSYRRKLVALKTLSFILFYVLSLMVLWSGYTLLTYQKNIYRYSLNWPSQIIQQNYWWGRLNPALPIYRENRLGKPAEPMNIQFSGDIQLLKNALIAGGWKSAPPSTLLNHTLQRLSKTHANVNTYLPPLYLNKPPLLSMVFQSGNEKIIFNLWRSNVYLSETWDVILIGNITKYCIGKNDKKITYSFNALNKIINSLKPDEWRTTLVLTRKIPIKLFEKYWNGEVLQISAPTLY